MGDGPMESGGLLDEIRVWMCPICGYWRQEKTTGVHQADDPDNWRGRPVTHELVEVVFVRAAPEGLLRDA